MSEGDEYEGCEVSIKRKHYDEEEYDSSEVKLFKKTGSQSSADTVHLKFLVPSNAAGAIIGKGGDQIAHIQNTTGTKMKMSKAQDFFPGTSERVCLVIGSFEKILKVYDFISEKIKERPDSTKHNDDSKNDRSKQAKILVPNSTAGMIIGKGGSYIRQIKEETNAHISISAKSSDLSERVATISGDDEARRSAFALVLEKIVEDPQHNSCPGISYANYSYGNSAEGPYDTNGLGFAFAMNSVNEKFLSGGVTGLAAANASLSNVSLQVAGLANLAQIINNVGGVNQLTADYLKAVLLSIGYSEQSTLEIIQAIDTLMSYGLISSSSYPGHGSFMGNILQNVANVNSKVDNVERMGLSHGYSNPSNVANILFSRNGETTGSSFFKTVQPNSIGQGSLFKDSFNQEKFEMPISDNITGNIIGPGGKGLLDIQAKTGASIHISHKGTFIPGTQNRILTITGNSNAIRCARELLMVAIRREERRRSK